MAEKRSGVVRIPSADLPTQSEGWVEISAYVKRRHMPYVATVQTLDVKVLENPKAPATARAREMQKLDELLAEFVYAWDWKDGDGVPYPQPFQNIEAFGELRQSEWAWLQGQVNRIMAQERIPKESDTP